MAKRPAPKRPFQRNEVRIPPASAAAPIARSARPLRARSDVFDPSKYPNLGSNPALERALFIQRRLMSGMGRDEAAALADERFGPLVPRPRAAQGKTRARHRAAPHKAPARKAHA